MELWMGNLSSNGCLQMRSLNASRLYKIYVFHIATGLKAFSDSRNQTLRKRINAVHLAEWTEKTREVTDNATKVWIQIGGAAEAVSVCRACNPDVLVVQGTDAGGHGLNHGASVTSLLPEVCDSLYERVTLGELSEMPILLAAGGIADGRGVAATLVLGTEGVVMGTKYLASEEAEILQGYKNDVLQTVDGGQTTVRCSVYDTLRGTTDWPEQYGGRGVINQSYHDALNGIPREENKRLYAEAVRMGDKGWGGVQGNRMTYAGTAVGLV